MHISIWLLLKIYSLNRSYYTFFLVTSVLFQFHENQTLINWWIILVHINSSCLKIVFHNICLFFYHTWPYIDMADKNTPYLRKKVWRFGVSETPFYVKNILIQILKHIHLYKAYIKRISQHTTVFFLMLINYVL